MSDNIIPKTIICDIDGCILEHLGDLTKINLENPNLLLGAKEKFIEWNMKSYKIILLTGRPESMREITNKQLQSFGLFWDILIMGATRGERILINDIKPTSTNNTATAINLKRNEGLALCLYV
jgi:hypothetical protein